MAIIAGNSNGIHINKTPCMNSLVPTLKKSITEPKTTIMIIIKDTILEKQTESVKIAGIIFLNQYLKCLSVLYQVYYFIAPCMDNAFNYF